MWGSSPPVILLVFANDRRDGSGYLRRLDAERRQIRRLLDPARDAGQCQLEVVANATLDDVLDRIDDHRDAIVGVHFGGHADPEGLKLEDDHGALVNAFAHGLADVFAGLPALRWVVLNGCGTRAHVDTLRGDRPVAIVATDTAIRDDLAHAFSSRFYDGVRSGRTIRDAFDSASARLKAVVERPEDAIEEAWRFGRAVELTDTWPWRLHDAGADWALPPRPTGLGLSTGALLALALALLLVVGVGAMTWHGRADGPDFGPGAGGASTAGPAGAKAASPPTVAPDAVGDVGDAVGDVGVPDATSAADTAVAPAPPVQAPPDPRIARRAAERRAHDADLAACRCADAARHLAVLSDLGLDRSRPHAAACAEVTGRCARALSSRLSAALDTCRCADARALQRQLARDYGLDRLDDWTRRCAVPGVPGSCI